MINSKTNEQVKYLNKLKMKKFRDLENRFLVYGDHLINQAKKHQVVLEIYTSNPQKEGIKVSKEIMKLLNQTETPMDSLALCEKKQIEKASKRVLLLDDVQDPDNVGALIRSASAFGFDHIILSLHSADLYNEKVIRASKGAFFDCFIERVNSVEALKTLKKNDYQIIGADAHQKTTKGESDKICLVLGNEGQGISEPVKALIDSFVQIETKHVESLNVSVAGAILMHEWRSL